LLFFLKLTATDLVCSAEILHRKPQRAEKQQRSSLILADRGRFFDSNRSMPQILAS
jgi:hypothetical protein